MGSIPGSVKSNTMSPKLAITATFLMSYVAQALSRADGPAICCAFRHSMEAFLTVGQGFLTRGKFTPWG